MPKISSCIEITSSQTKNQHPLFLSLCLKMNFYKSNFSVFFQKFGLFSPLLKSCFMDIWMAFKGWFQWRLGNFVDLVNKCLKEVLKTCTCGSTQTNFNTIFFIFPTVYVSPNLLGLAKIWAWLSVHAQLESYILLMRWEKEGWPILQTKFTSCWVHCLPL